MDEDLVNFSEEYFHRWVTRLPSLLGVVRTRQKLLEFHNGFTMAILFTALSLTNLEKEGTMGKVRKRNHMQLLRNTEPCSTVSCNLSLKSYDVFIFKPCLSIILSDELW